MIAMDLLDENLKTIGELLYQRERIPSDLIRNIRLAVNLVARELTDTDLAADFLKLLDKLPVR